MKLNIEELKKNFTGDIIQPEHNEYEQARSIFMFKGSPAIVLRPNTVKDVTFAINYARSNSLVISIRSGGHSGAGFSTNEGGLVIDLSKINTIEILENNHVRIGPGAHWFDVANKLQEKGLALSSGDTKSVGVGGLTLSGGIGWMVRKYGLTFDSLISAEIVTADGKIMQVSATENPDLFWAIRGGGGNFGVVTSFELEAHPVTKVISGSIMYTLDNLAELLKGWRDYMRTADENLTTILNIFPGFGGNPPAAMLTVCFAGDDEMAAMETIKPLTKLGKVLKQDIKSKNYADVLEDAHAPPGMRVIVKSLFVKDFNDKVIEIIVSAKAISPNMILQIRSVGGAMNRVSSDATAFAHRDSEMFLVMPMFVPPNADDQMIANALKPWEMIASSGKGGYIGFFSEKDEDVKSIYTVSAYERLAKVKKVYDPENIFSQNYNVKPAI